MVLNNKKFIFHLSAKFKILKTLFKKIFYVFQKLPSKISHLTQTNSNYAQKKIFVKCLTRPPEDINIKGTKNNNCICSLHTELLFREGNTSRVVFLMWELQIQRKVVRI